MSHFLNKTMTGRQGSKCYKYALEKRLLELWQKSRPLIFSFFFEIKDAGDHPTFSTDHYFLFVFFERGELGGDGQAYVLFLSKMKWYSSFWAKCRNIPTWLQWVFLVFLLLGNGNEICNLILIIKILKTLKFLKVPNWLSGKLAFSNIFMVFLDLNFLNRNKLLFVLLVLECFFFQKTSQNKNDWSLRY